MKVTVGSSIRKVILSLLALAVFAGVHPDITAQNVSSASVGGIVQDINGAAVAAVTLTATNVDTNQARTSVTDRQGRFKFPYLPVGSYKLSAAASGFHT